MALHDVDYNNEQRDMAMPSNHDVASERGADGTRTITQKVNTNTGPYVSTKDAVINVYDGQYTRIAIGLLPDGTYGLVITKPGFNVTDVFA